MPQQEHRRHHRHEQRDRDQVHRALADAGGGLHGDKRAVGQVRADAFREAEPLDRRAEHGAAAMLHAKGIGWRQEGLKPSVRKAGSP